ncbi:hypothetical protein LX69_00955 [Breznakibacter xylanolyticus]|uniref:Lipocalin-like protein n=1 Tax=Breznakibacter xylanolyticus TaxID=990 RepID=A0A2W7P1I4_9BACT|nr:hypothetical protein [Breznakibacter xylanolyticus]PZX19286.1 hypothetical protein LX69_00955 [Breznakibacter xylanolyticus]
MKTIKMFGLLLMATLVFASCSKDDDDDAASIAGTTWESSYVKFQYGNAITEYKNVAEIKEEDEYQKFTLKADGTVVSDTNEEIGKWTQSGSKVTFIDEDKDEYEYSLSGNTLTYSVSTTVEGTIIASTVKFTKI